MAPFSRQGVRWAIETQENKMYYLQLITFLCGFSCVIRNEKVKKRINSMN